jgi:hypothetical protein
MGPGPARVVAGAVGNRPGGASAMPAAGWRWRAGMFVLTAAAGLALASGAVTGAAQAVAVVTATAVNCPPPSTAITASSDGNPGC